MNKLKTPTKRFFWVSMQGNVLRIKRGRGVVYEVLWGLVLKTTRVGLFDTRLVPSDPQKKFKIEVTARKQNPSFARMFKLKDRNGNKVHMICGTEVCQTVWQNLARVFREAGLPRSDAYDMYHDGEGKA